MVLDRRRGWARVRALVACLVGVTIFALSAASVRHDRFRRRSPPVELGHGTSILDAPVWSWAPGGAGALGAAAVVVSFVGAFWYFWRGASPQVLKEVDARPLDPATAPEVVNVVEALSIGIGESAPALYVTQDPAPNALSLRSRRSPDHRRDERVRRVDPRRARGVVRPRTRPSVGRTTLTGSRRGWSPSPALVASVRAIMALGVVLFVIVAGIAHYTDIVLWSTGVVSAGPDRPRMDLETFAAQARAQRASPRRTRSRTSRPSGWPRTRQSLGAVCARLAAEPRPGHTGRVAIGADVVRGGRDPGHRSR